jgi:hypothetical protein
MRRQITHVDICVTWERIYGLRNKNVDICVTWERIYGLRNKN